MPLFAMNHHAPHRPTRMPNDDLHLSPMSRTLLLMMASAEPGFWSALAQPIRITCASALQHGKHHIMQAVPCQDSCPFLVYPNHRETSVSHSLGGLAWDCAIAVAGSTPQVALALCGRSEHVECTVSWSRR